MAASQLAPMPFDVLPRPGQPIEERHLASAIQHMAYVVVRYGEVYAPLLDRLEHELGELQRRQSPTDRARRLLASVLPAQTDEGGRRAIC